MNNFVRNTIFVIIFIFGFTAGLIKNDIPFFSVNGEVGITDLANLILTIVVAFLIPLSLSPIITNKRTIKDFLINETKNCIDFLISIKSIIEENSLKNEDSDDAKKRINYMISTGLGAKISSLTEQLNTSFKKQSYKDIRNIDENYKEYWQEITGGELMSNDFKFDIKFCLSHDKGYRKIESCLKKIIHNINNYK